MNYIVRKASESDNIDIARTISYSFEKVLSVLTKDMERMAKVFENGLDIERFYVAQQGDKIIGIVACGDSEGRAVKTTKEECKRHLGPIRGLIAFRLISSELMRPHSYPAATGYIDILGVLEQARGKGVAKELLKAIVENNSKYTEFILDVDSINASAIKTYTDFGFVEYRRVPVVKFSKRSRVFMRYIV